MTYWRRKRQSSAIRTADSLPRVEAENERDGEYAVQYLTEKKILDALLGDIAAAQEGDSIQDGHVFHCDA